MRLKSVIEGLSLRVYMLVFLAAFVAVTIGGVAMYIDKFKTSLGEETNVRLKETAQYAADHITTVIADTKQKLRGVAAAMTAMTSSSQKLSYLRQVSRESGFVYLGYAGYDGELHATIPSESGYVGEESYYLAALAGRDTISDYIRKIFSNRAARGILITVPIFARDPRPDPVGALVAMLDSKRLRDALNLQSFDGEGYAYIVNRKGMVIMRTRSLDFDNVFLAWKERKFAEGYSLRQFERSVAAGENGMTIFENANGNRQFVYHYALPFNNWTLINMVSEEAVAGGHMRMISELTIFGGIMVAIFAALVAYVVYSYWIAWRSRVSAQAKSGFLSSMSHEIRTPLNGIIGLNYLMRGNVDNREKMLRFLDQSQATAEYLLSLINDILDINKLDADKMETASKPFRMDSLVENISTIFSSILRSKNINFIVNADIPFPKLVGDEVRLKQVLTNILGNASKFTPADGSITLDVSQHEDEADNVVTRIVITDTGCGMSKDFQKRIFDAFSQERNTCTSGSEGTGLGMAISFQLMRKMGGSLSVKSALGEGSSFTAELPLQKAVGEKMPAPMPAFDPYPAASASPAPSSAAPQPPLPQAAASEALAPEPEAAAAKDEPGLSVLVAEDNELNRELLQEILEMNGMKVATASDGQEAVDAFAASSPGEYDLILMDMQMPVMDGVTATRAIRALKRPDAAQIPIFACTANSFEEDREKCLQSGMSGFLAKPVNVPQLLRTLAGQAMTRQASCQG